MLVLILSAIYLISIINFGMHAFEILNTQVKTLPIIFTWKLKTNYNWIALKKFESILIVIAIQEWHS